MPRKEKHLGIIQKILEHKPFRKSFVYYCNQSEAPPINKIVCFMKQSELHKVNSEKTYRRRAQTVLKWTEWIFDLIDE